MVLLSSEQQCLSATNSCDDNSNFTVHITFFMILRIWCLVQLMRKNYFLKGQVHVCKSTSEQELVARRYFVIRENIITEGYTAQINFTMWSKHLKGKQGFFCAGQGVWICPTSFLQWKEARMGSLNGSLHENSRIVACKCKRRNVATGDPVKANAKILHHFWTMVISTVRWVFKR